MIHLNTSKTNQEHIKPINNPSIMYILIYFISTLHHTIIKYVAK